jgi:heavy metal sensor kinase
MLHSLRWRLTGWYVLLLAAILALFSSGVYLAVRQLLVENVDQMLQHQARLVAQAIDEDDGVLTLTQDVLLPDVRDQQHFTRIYRADQSLSFSDGGAGAQIPAVPDALANALSGRQHLGEVQLGTTTLRVASFPVSDEGRIAGVLQVGVALRGIEETMRTLLQVLLVLAPAMLLIASGGGWFLANRALAPIDQITRTAERISVENLSRRIGVQGLDDEVGRLARTFDTMLARLEAAFARQRQFTADASHELRTPLTAIIGRIDVALGWPGSVEGYQATLRSVREQMVRLTRLSNDLLWLARIDSQPSTLPAEPIDLSSILPAVAAQLEPLAHAQRVTLTLPAIPPLVVVGNEDQLIRLFLNLLDNAIRYTPLGGLIALAISSDAGQVAVRVRDTGPGIAPEHLPHLFDRFYRADRGRSRAEGSSGLGLAIAQGIAQAHGGGISVASTPGAGSTFTVWLPRADREPNGAHL